MTLLAIELLPTCLLWQQPRSNPRVFIHIPRDVEVVKEIIGIVQENRDELAFDLATPFHLPAQASPCANLPVSLCDLNAKLNTSIVLLIVVNDVDAMVYANSLREYLEKDFMGVILKSPVRGALEPMNCGKH